MTLAFLAEAVEEIEDEALSDAILSRMESWLERRRG
jgi:Fe-S cluster assembly protein SufD